MRGLVYFHLEQYDSAISDFRDAIARDPAPAKVHTCLGGAYAMIAEYELAVERYEQAIGIDPGYEEPHFGLEAIRAFLGNRGGEAREPGSPTK